MATFLDIAISDDNIHNKLKRKMGRFTRGISILALTALTGIANSQSTFEKRIGGTGTDSGRSVEQTSDGYLTVGHTTTNSSGWADIYVTKSDLNGSLLWEKKLGGSGLDLGFTIDRTSDGNFLISGTTTSFGTGGEDAYLIKINGDGEVIWEKYYGGWYSERIEAAYEDNNGDIISVGIASGSGGVGTDLFLLKTDDDGNEIWQRTFGGAEYDAGNVVVPAQDGGYVVAGQTMSNGEPNGDYYILKVDSDGNKIWDKTYGGIGIEEAKDIIATSDGGYLVLGDAETNSAGGDDGWLMKLDGDGDLVWDKMFGGDKKEAFKNVSETNDGGLLLIGHTRSFGLVNPDMWVIHTDNEGNVIWERKFGQGGHEHGYDVKQTPDGGFIIVGHSDYEDGMNEQIYLVKLNSQGTFDSTNTSVSSPAVVKNMNIFPNPSNGIFSIEVNESMKGYEMWLMDLSGKVLDKLTVEGEGTQRFDLSYLNRGVYIGEVRNSGERFVSRIVIE